MKLIDIEVEGIAPLLHHRYPFKDEAELMGKRKAGAVDHTQEWKKSLYWSDDIGIYQPATHFEAAMIKMAVNYQIVGKGKKTYKDLFKAAVFVKPDLIPFGLNGSLEKLLSEGLFTIDKAAVVVQKARVERYRPRFDEWKLKFQIEVHDEQIPTEIIKNVLDDAGKFSGIGDFRPRYGRFMVTNFQAVDR